MEQERARITAEQETLLYKEQFLQAQIELEVSMIIIIII